PESYQRLQDGDDLLINNRKWQVVIGSGHSPEHVCLYCPELKVFISGDQVIPRITSNVSIFPLLPDANPLENWLNSCARLKQLLPDDILILPSHQEPFYGLHHRLEELIQSHQEALERLLAYLQQPRIAIDCIQTMFGREISISEMQFAIGETLAHLKYLEQLGQIEHQTADDGFDYYVKLDK
ncbi:MAG: MBL fold metallo-hydrolase, partial [Gammaproteobacteria bacterium]